MAGNRSSTLAAMIGVVALSTGCAGARTTVAADSAAYPISLSRAVRDSDGRIASSEHTLKVGALHHEATAWGLLYSAIRLTPRTDISEAVNAQVRAAGGNAVVRVRVSAAHCASDFFFLLTTIPVWPGCAKLVVTGDIVKVTSEAASASPSPRTAAR